MLPPAGGVETDLALTFSLQVKTAPKHTFSNCSIINGYKNNGSDPKHSELTSYLLLTLPDKEPLNWLIWNTLRNSLQCTNGLFFAAYIQVYMLSCLEIQTKGRYHRNSLCFGSVSANAPCVGSLLGFETEPILLLRHHHFSVLWIILEFYYETDFDVFPLSFSPVRACFYTSSTLIFWNAREISCKSCFSGGRGTKTEQFWVTRLWLLVL